MANPSTSQNFRRSIFAPKPATFRPHLNKECDGLKAVKCRNLHPEEIAYEKICELITNPSFVIENIVQVDNPVLKSAYKLKKQQKKQWGEVNECLLFHGTKKQNLNNICTYNFDWRLNKRHKYGRGVCFSRNAMYAAHYSDADEYHQGMIVAKVLISDVCIGDHTMIMPPTGFDTAQNNEDGSVVVKFEDNEFYPAYKLYYHIDDDDDYDGSDSSDSFSSESEDSFSSESDEYDNYNAYSYNNYYHYY